MGQFLQGGNLVHFVSYFFKKYNILVTKPDGIDLIFAIVFGYLYLVDPKNPFTLSLGLFWSRVGHSALISLLTEPPF